MTDLTPYDTGVRAEPHVWPVNPGQPDTYGRVDFEDDASQAVATIYVERSEEGGYIVHVLPADEIGVVVHFDHDIEVIEGIDGHVVAEAQE